MSVRITNSISADINSNHFLPHPSSPPSSPPSLCKLHFFLPSLSLLVKSQEPLRRLRGHVEIADSFWHVDTGPRTYGATSAPTIRHASLSSASGHATDGESLPPPPQLRVCCRVRGTEAPALALRLSLILLFPLRLVHLHELAATVRGAGQHRLLPPRTRRALQMRRHVPHPFSSVVGAKRIVGGWSLLRCYEKGWYVQYIV
ncbi:hypothetical protein B0H13DRAFT_2656637 [Mycena leptocephala]|nr:hypothetical protein B0H13DRAFT_2656637 [Mycena leptocephala]